MLLAIKYSDVFHTVKQWTDRNLIQYRFYLGLNAIPRKICPLTELSVGSATKGRNCRGGFVRKAPQVRSFRTGKEGHDTPPHRRQRSGVVRLPTGAHSLRGGRGERTST